MKVLVKNDPFIKGFRMASVENGFWEELSSCPICNQSKFLKLISVVRGKDNGVISSMCTDCQFSFLKRRPTVEWFNKFYSTEWDAEHRTKMKNEGFSLKSSSKVLEFCEKFLTKKNEPTVLDIGAGMGVDLMAFKEGGYKVFGLERSAHRAKYLNEVLGIPCAHSSLENFKGEKSYDLVFTDNVLEHASDPFVHLKLQKNLLKEDGLLYIAVPNYWAEYPPQTFNFVPHLFSFSAFSLQKMLKALGFSILSIECGREIQILATLSKDVKTQSEPVTSNPNFYQETEAYILKSFILKGDKDEENMLLWYEDQNFSQWYRNHVLKYSIFRYGAIVWGRMGRLYRWLLFPRTTKRFFEAAKGRMLHIKIEGPYTLPVEFRYENDSNKVWVK